MEKGIPYLFGHDAVSLADQAVFGELTQLSFAEMRLLQAEFEKLRGLHGQTLGKLNNPHYLLTRGIMGEAGEAHEALVDPERGPQSEAFKNEVVDILVFIGNLLNRAEISQAVFEQLLEQKLTHEHPTTLSEIFKTELIAEANASVAALVALGPASPEFREQLVAIAALVLQALELMQLSPAELNHRFAQVLVKNFVKYRPEVIRKHTLSKGMAVSRKNFGKKVFVPITSQNVNALQAEWEVKDKAYRERQRS